ncbi:MAG TPA: hypothetical protein VFE36_02670 [Candidatus Baltobacteraceae bacterium]|nr:hypothetical protein [Candidatus Baltobacteraceae bacterium]
MILWMTRDAFWAAVLGIVVIALFVGYNTSKSLKRRYRLVKRDDSDAPSKWN